MVLWIKFGKEQKNWGMQLFNIIIWYMWVIYFSCGIQFGFMLRENLLYFWMQMIFGY